MSNAVTRYFNDQVMTRKMNSPIGILAFSFSALVFAYATVFIGYQFGPALVIALAGLIFILVCIKNPLVGFYLMATISLFTFYVGRFLSYDLHISSLLEILIFAIFIGALLQQKKSAEEKSSFYKSPPTIAMLVYFVFVLIEGFNPNMYSMVGWLFYVRRFMEFLMVYYLGYKLFDDMPKVRNFIKFWLILALLNALYTCKQQWLGLSQFEITWLNQDPHLVALYFQGGVIRKFSFLSDPAANGVWMASMAAFSLVLAIWETNFKRKIILIVSMILMVLAMSYSGTRTASVVFIGGVVFYICMTINLKSSFFFLVFFAMLFLFLVWVPTENATIYRFQTAFRASDEESLQVRDINRKSVQPYIYSHPFGGGLATSSQEGMRYNPGHYLAGFPSDSGFLKSAIETGWIGLAIALLYFFSILYQGVTGFFKAKNKEIRVYIIAISAAIVIFILAQYSQVSIGQFPALFFFYPCTALLTRLLKIDRELLSK